MRQQAQLRRHRAADVAERHRQRRQRAQKADLGRQRARDVEIAHREADHGGAGVVARRHHGGHAALELPAAATGLERDASRGDNLREARRRASRIDNGRQRSQFAGK